MTRPSARVRANRANAQKSTGPKTEDGKARSSRNAMRHGCSARRHDVIDAHVPTSQQTPGAADASTRQLRRIQQISAALARALGEPPHAAPRADILRMLRLMHRYDREARARIAIRLNSAGHAE